MPGPRWTNPADDPPLRKPSVYALIVTAFAAELNGLIAAIPRHGCGRLRWGSGPPHAHAGAPGAPRTNGLRINRHASDPGRSLLANSNRARSDPYADLSMHTSNCRRILGDYGWKRA